MIQAVDELGTSESGLRVCVVCVCVEEEVGVLVEVDVLIEVEVELLLELLLELVLS